MGIGSGILSFLSSKRRQKEREKERSFLNNGSMLLEKLIASCNGRGQITLRNFSTEELPDEIAINDFAKPFHLDAYWKIYRGSFEERSILVKKYDSRCSDHPCPSLPINDIAITAQMSKHKNVQKLLGYCLEFEFPALVYEYTTGGELLSNLLFKRHLYDDKSSILMWKMRLRIAKDIANVVVYLHSAFSTPIIHRDLKPSHIIVDQSGVAKLCDFCLAIPLPPGELQVQDSVVGTCGYVAPEYCSTGIVTQKVDVYSFGMLLLMIFTGRPFTSLYKENWVMLADWVKERVAKDHFSEIVDLGMLDEEGREGKEQQFQAFLALALRCIENKGEDRPEMIDVAKELRRIEKSLCS